MAATSRRPLSLLLVGGGNAVHTMAALAAAQPRVFSRVSVLTVYGNEAERFGATITARR